ncbi:hypothetical protein CRI94_15400 [Longibacter salinarum]|uniref:Replication protein n=1 Tax=Longibacter salinarum TaxID=1850348 RepID=A0A2A8CUE8_9BACT|nr:hypothetical protein CRI94_15400 [Longibacter salinarum]
MRLLHEHEARFGLTLSIRPGYFDDTFNHRLWLPHLADVHTYLIDKFRRLCAPFIFFRYLEWDSEQDTDGEHGSRDKTIPHYHYVMAAKPKEPSKGSFPELAEKYFARKGAGCSACLDTLTSLESLQNWVGYCAKTLTRPSRRTNLAPPKTRWYSASQGFGFNSTEQVALRSDVARENAGDDAFCLDKHLDRVIHRQLAKKEGEAIRLPDGREGILLRSDHVQSEVCIDGSVEWFSNQELVTEDLDIPPVMHFHPPERTSGDIFNQRLDSDQPDDEKPTAFTPGAKAHKSRFILRNDNREIVYEREL